MLSILCHSHGLLFARATLGLQLHRPRNGPYSRGSVCRDCCRWVLWRCRV